MVTRSARQTDIAVAVRTFSVNVRFAVFPFVAAQKKPLLQMPAEAEIFQIFRRALHGIFGEHTEKHQRADTKGDDVQQQAQGRVFDKNRKHRNRKVSDKHTARERIGTVPAPEKRLYFLFHRFIPFFGGDDIYYRENIRHNIGKYVKIL